MLLSFVAGLTTFISLATLRDAADRVACYTLLYTSTQDVMLPLENEYVKEFDNDVGEGLKSYMGLYEADQERYTNSI